MGLATARRLLDEGAYVVITGRDEDRLHCAATELDAGPRVLAVRADAANLDDLDALMRSISTWRGHLDAIFTNAGTAIFTTITELTEADVDRSFDVNFKGVFFTVQKALPLLKERRPRRFLPQPIVAASSARAGRHLIQQDGEGIVREQDRADGWTMTGEQRGAHNGLAKLVAFIAIPIGLVLLGVGIFGYVNDPDAAPICDGKAMTPGTECWTYGDSHGVTSYEELAERQRQNLESARDMVPIGVVILLIGIAAFAVSRQGTSSGGAVPRAMPVPQTPSKPADEMNTLLGMVLGNTAAANRLIGFELRADPSADRATAIDRAIERLRADRGRHG